MQLVQQPEADKAHVFAGYLPEVLICFSHLRWDFVFQRPQHILNRLARRMRVFYIEEPVDDSPGQAHYTLLERGNQITVLVPHLPPGLNPPERLVLQQQLFDDFMAKRPMSDTAFWYYTPMALLFSRHYTPALTVFDCMDELSAFRFAPQELKDLETELLEKADIVFTGGQSLYEAKKDRHQNIHAFPSIIDKQHFGQARKSKTKRSRHFTLGFYGVIDERFDIELIRGIAGQRPCWDIVLIGPVVKIDPDTLPVNGNIHYTGPKSYSELPKLISAWDMALIPFLLNESTRFISPTKTPEYLAAGLPVISTPIRDVVKPYGERGLVHIGRDPAEFIELAEELQAVADQKEWLQRVDFFLADNSWEKTCERMLELITPMVKTGEQPETAIKAAGNYA